MQGRAGADAVVLQALTPEIAVSAADPATFAVPNASALDVGGMFILRGYSLSSRQLAPGSTLDVSLFWQTEGGPGTDYALAAWLIGPGGQRVELGTHPPLGGDYPTRLWQAGQWVRDRFNLKVPAGLPPGVYQLFVAWQSPDGTALSAGGSRDISLGEISLAGG